MYHLISFSNTTSPRPPGKEELYPLTHVASPVEFLYPAMMKYYCSPRDRDPMSCSLWRRLPHDQPAQGLESSARKEPTSVGLWLGWAPTLAEVSCEPSRSQNGGGVV